MYDLFRTATSFRRLRIAKVFKIMKDLLSDQDNSLINPFIPEFLMWTLPSLNLDMSTDGKRGFSLKSKTERTVSSRFTVCTGICFGHPD